MQNLESTAHLPSVSVVIAAYNCAATVAASIESCLAQTHPPAEVIVVNDGSSDDTPAVLAAFGDRIKVIHRPNGGLASARNTGTQAARGDCIAWMDADDLMQPDKLRLQATVLATHASIGLVSTDFSAFSDPRRDFAASFIEPYYEAIGRLGGVANAYPAAETLLSLREASGTPVTLRHGSVYETLLWGNFVHPPTIMARRSLHEAAGIFDAELRYSSDYELILRMARLAVFGFIDAPLLRYRVSPAQMSRAASQGKLQLETVRILSRVKEADPELFARRQSLIRRRIAESLFSAAASIGSADRPQAFGLLQEGLRKATLPLPALRAAARIALPMPVLRWISKLRRHAGPSRRAA